MALVGACLCALVSWFDLVRPLDRIFYDFANEASPLPSADDIIMIAIDERSILAFGRWPWPRERHVELLRLLQKAEPAAVAIDIIFSEPDVEYPQVDQLLAKEIGKLGNVVLPVFLARADRGRQLLEIKPIPAIADSAARLGHVHIQVDADGLTRSVYLQEGLGTPHWAHFSMAVASVLGLDMAPLSPERAAGVKMSGPILPIARTHNKLIPFRGPAGTVTTVSYVDVIRGRVPLHQLHNKIVFVGATAAGRGDNVTISLGQISGVEFNVNVFQALRSGKLAEPATKAMSSGVALLFTLVTILLFTRLRPGPLLAAVLLSALIVPLAALLLLKMYQLWISPAPVVLVVILAYPLWNWLRLAATFDFVQDQLGLLKKEAGLAAPISLWLDIERTASFLQALRQVKSWELRVIKAIDSADNVGGSWRHSKGCSGKYFTAKGEFRLLLLNWVGDTDASSQALNNLFPGGDEIATSPEPYHEAVLQDLNQLESAYSQARHNRELIASTVDQLNAGLILSDLSGTIVLKNQQARTLLALPGDQGSLLDALDQIAIESELKIEEQLSALVLNDTPFSREGRIGGRERHLLCRGGLIMLDRKMLLFTITDVSELKASERIRVEALNFLSHDLRAPLTSVLALIEGAKTEHHDKLNLELLANIEDYIHRNLLYAENFIQLSRLENVDAPPFNECDAQSIVDNAVAQQYHMAREKGITLGIVTSKDDIWVSCNRSLLERALLNLIDNALKHSPRGASITVILSCDEHEAIFEVVDEGEGIPAEDLDRIFGPFQQGLQARSGVGLGLRFVSSIARTHNGSISVRSELNNGSTFTLKVPRLI